MEGDAGLVDGELFEVRAAVTVELGVEVGKEAALEEGVVGEVDAADDVAGLELGLYQYCISIVVRARRTYHGLLGLGKVVARVAVELHLTQRRDGNELLRNDLGRIQQIKAKPQLIILIHDLRTQLPLRIVTVLDRLKQILANKVRVLARDLLRLFPDHTGATLQ